MSATRRARADALRDLLEEHGGDFLLDRRAFETLAHRGFTRAEVNAALDDLSAAGAVELTTDRYSHSIVVRLRREAK